MKFFVHIHWLGQPLPLFWASWVCKGILFPLTITAPLPITSLSSSPDWLEDFIWMDLCNMRPFVSVFFNVHWVMACINIWWHCIVCVCVCMHVQSTFDFSSPLMNIWVIIVSNNDKFVYGNMFRSLLIIHLSRLTGFLVNFVTCVVPPPLDYKLDKGENHIWLVTATVSVPIYSRLSGR